MAPTLALASYERTTHETRYAKAKEVKGLENPIYVVKEVIFISLQILLERKNNTGTSLVVQRICLLLQGTQLQSLVQ